MVVSSIDLKNGHVARKISTRDYSIELIAKSGVNKYLNPFRRLGARYLEIYSKSPIKVNYIGIRNVFYPLEIIDKKFKKNILEQN